MGEAISGEWRNTGTCSHNPVNGSGLGGSEHPGKLPTTPCKVRISQQILVTALALVL